MVSPSFQTPKISPLCYPFSLCPLASSPRLGVLQHNPWWGRGKNEGLGFQGRSFPFPVTSYLHLSIPGEYQPLCWGFMRMTQVKSRLLVPEWRKHETCHSCLLHAMLHPLQ